MPNGPNLLGAFQRIRRLRDDPLGTFAADARQYGDVVSYRFGPTLPPLTLVSRPDLVQQVLQRNHRNYRRSPFYKLLEPLLGKGLVTNDGPSWLRQRRLMQPAFHREHLRGLADAMVEQVEGQLARWRRLPEEHPIDLFEEMTGLTLAIAAQTLFHADVERHAPVVRRALPIALREFDLRTSELVHVPDWIPTPRNRRLHRVVRELDAVVLEIIADRRRTPDAHHDLLGMLMDAQDEDSGERMDDKQLRDEVMTLLLAGHETTSNLLCWTWLLLTEHPDALTRLRAEVDAVLGDRPPVWDDLTQLTFTRQVLDESMRLYPPVWLVDRVAIGPDQLDDTPILPGGIVMVNIWLTHRRPDVWPEPERFDPDRFAAGADPERHRFAHIPFGAGPHHCIGNHFALIEATFALALLAREFSFSFVDRAAIRPQASVTLRPRDRMPMRLHHRTAP